MDKICTKCSVLQPAEEFSPLKEGAGGMSCWCKGCKRNYAKEHYLKNKQKYKEKGLKWNRDNPDKVKKIKQKYKNS